MSSDPTAAAGECICDPDPDRACMAACEVCLRSPDYWPCPARGASS